MNRLSGVRSHFADILFPLNKIGESIEHETVAYHAEEKLKLKDLDAMSSVTGDSTDIAPDFEHFSMFEPLGSDFLSWVQKAIVNDIPYTNDNNTGLAEGSFEWNAGSPGCEFVTSIMVSLDVTETTWPDMIYTSGILKSYSQL